MQTGTTGLLVRGGAQFSTFTGNEVSLVKCRYLYQYQNFTGEGEMGKMKSSKFVSCDCL